MMDVKNYSDLCDIQTFEERYAYLRMGGTVGAETFGHSRYINQGFYMSNLWRSVRDKVIIRDSACDLGISDRQINDKIFVHHMNPITEDDVENLTEMLLNPEFLICVSGSTHNAIHYGDANLLAVLPKERVRNDTSPWLQ